MNPTNEIGQQDFSTEFGYQIDIRLHRIMINNLESEFPFQVSFDAAPSGDSIRSVKSQLFDEESQLLIRPEIETDLELYSGHILESESMLLITKLTVQNKNDSKTYAFRLDIEDFIGVFQEGEAEFRLEPLFDARESGPDVVIQLNGNTSFIGEMEIVDRGEHIAHKFLYEEFELQKYGLPMNVEFIKGELASINDWQSTLSDLMPPSDNWFERAMDGPIALFGEDVLELEVVENPAPGESFGYISEAIHIHEVNQEEPLDILMPLYGEIEVDRDSVYIFRWDEDMEHWNLQDFSIAHPSIDVGWMKIYRPGTYVAVGMPTDPTLKMTINLFSEMSPLIRSARAAGQELAIVQQICQYILCNPHMLKPAISQTWNGTYEMTKLLADKEQLTQQYHTEIENPPTEQAGLPHENVPVNEHGGYPLPVARRHTVGGQRIPKGSPRVFPMGAGVGICEKCYGIKFPDKIPESKIKIPRVWDPFQPTIFTPRPAGPLNKDTWSEIPMTFPSNVIRDLAIDPDDSNIIYAAAQRGGVWRTLDGGKNWKAMTDGLMNLNAYAITVARKKKTGAKYRTVFFGSKYNLLGDDHDIYASEDQGKSWKLLSKIFATEIWELTTAKDDEKIIYAATNYGLFKSTDGGNSWPVAKCKIDGIERVNRNGILDAVCYDICIDPNDDKVIWVCARKIGILKSKDEGKTWINTTKNVTTMKVNVRTQIDIGQDNSSTGHGSDFVVAKSRKNIAYTINGGSKWEEMAIAEDVRTQDGWCSTLAVCPSNENFVTIGGFWQFYTTNLKEAATKWKKVPDSYWVPWGAPERTNEYHPDQQIVRFDPNDHTRFFLGSDAGISRIDSKGTRTERISDGINSNQLFYLDISQTGNFEIGTSTYHCGIVRKESGSSIWKYVAAAEGGIYRIDPYDSKLHFCDPWGEGLHRSKESGVQGSWKQILKNKKKIPTKRFEFRPGTSREIWGGINNDQLQYSTDRGLTWFSVKDNQGKTLKLDKYDTRFAGVASIDFAPSDDKIIYIGTSGGRVWYTKNAGKKSKDWKQVNATPKTPINVIERTIQSNISAVAIHPKKSDHIYIGYSLHNQNTFYVTIDGGKIWTQRHGSAANGGRLPNFPVVDIIIDPNDANKIYVAMEFGIYFTNNGGIYWYAINSGLPNVQLREMRFRKSTRTLFIATNGRGIYQAKV